MEFLSVAVDKLWNYTVVPIAKQVGYLIFYRYNVNELTEEVEALQLARQRVQHEVDAALRKGERIEADVRKWLQEVDEISQKSDDLKNDKCHAKAGCSSRSFPNIYYRHKLSRQSKKIVEKVERMKSKTSGNFDRVSFRDFLKTSIVARELMMSIQNDVMKALEDPMIHTIGVYGWGGVSKTALVHAIAKKAQQDKIFDVVALANVTQSPDLEKIQQQIVDKLGLQYEEENFTERACGLRVRLNMKRERILIILNDLWEELNINKVGIPPAHKDLKILMTSINRELLSYQMKARKTFFLDVLTEEEERKLSVNTCMKRSEFAESHELISKIITQAVDESKAKSAQRTVEAIEVYLLYFFPIIFLFRILCILLL